MNRNHPLILDSLHLLVLTSFAIAQPMYDLLGQNPEFFVAHDISAWMLSGMIAVLSIGIALSLALIEMVANLAGQPVRQGLHYVFISVLCILITLPILKRVGMGDFAQIGVAIIVALVFGYSYAKWRQVRLFLTVLSPSVILFPILFLVFTPIGRFLFSTSIDAASGVKINNPVPVVLLVMDEFNTTALLDRSGQIDPVRFPNFRKFADSSYWFPNTVAAHIWTGQAVPAILTGQRADATEKRAPTAGDYPRNLFTMLGKNYYLNVHEPLTGLCPDALLPKQEHANARGGTSGLAFYADLAVVYAHIITPTGFMEALPPIGAKWSGFGQALLSEIESNASPLQYGTGTYKGMTNRDLQLSQFLSDIEKSPDLSLHFLHILLPHHPYTFLCTGQKYTQLPENQFPFECDDPTCSRHFPIDDDPLILTAYGQYLNQIGYMDHFIGDMIDCMKAKGIYDDALIIIAADHGVSVEGNMVSRILNSENARDILKFPLFVKLPHQHIGKIDNRLASGIDILPTIVDVLGISGWSEMDGQSMFASNGDSRTNGNIPGIGTFKATEMVGFPRLDWQIKKFGEHKPLRQLSIHGVYPQVIGQPLSALPIGPDSDLRLQSGDVELFDHVDLAGQFLPALFRGYVPAADDHSKHIAIALNGRVVATTQTSERKQGDANYFAVLLPPAAFVDGNNELKVFLIEDDDSGFQLKSVQSDHYAVKLAQENGQRFLSFSDSQKVLLTVNSDTVKGHVEKVTRNDDLVFVEGWAGDIQKEKPVDAIFAFDGNHEFAQTQPSFPRPDVVKYFNASLGLSNCGFRIAIPASTIDAFTGKIRVVAFVKGKGAVELYLSDKIKDQLLSMSSASA